MGNTFLVCTRDEPEVEWLQSSLQALGQVIKVGDNFEELFRLVEMMGVSVVFIGVDRHQQVHQCALIESLLEARPMVAVMATGDGYDSDVVIAAMRAGARDFITLGLRGSEVLGLVRRQMTRLPQLPSQADQADVAVLCSAQPDADAALVAAHLALELAEDGQEVLLVDLGVPVGESTAVLGIDCTFYFDDAIRNLRRLDSSVIESAFAQHGSGLRVLPLSDDTFQLELSNSAELFLLLGNLKQNFSQIVINLCGQRDSNMVRTLVSSADRLFWYIDQSVPCSRRNLNLLQQWRNEGIKLDHAELVVDRYINKLAPNAGTLASTFGMPLAACLPLSASLRLESRNQGEPMFDLAPRDPLSKALATLAYRIASKSSRQRSIWQRLRGVG